MKHVLIRWLAWRLFIIFEFLEVQYLLVCLIVFISDVALSSSVFYFLLLPNQFLQLKYMGTYMCSSKEVLVRFCPLSKVLSFSHHPRVHGYLSVSLHLDSRFYFLDFLTSLIFLLQFLKSVVNLHNFCNESMDSTDEFSFSQNKRPLPCPVLVATSFMCHSLHFMPHC